MGSARAAWVLVLVGFIVLGSRVLLIEHEGRTEFYWPEVVAVRAARVELRTNATEVQ